MLMTVSKGNAYDVALENFDAAADAMELSQDIREMIKYPERILMVTVPVRMDDGHIHRFEAYRAEHADTTLRPSGFLHPIGFNFGFVGLASDAETLRRVDEALNAMLASDEISALALKAGMTYVRPRTPDVQGDILLGDLKGP